MRRIFEALPGGEGTSFIALWEDFEDGVTAEAHFAHAADRAMPVLTNLANQGQSWRENGISHDRVVSKIGPPIREGCPSLWTYLEPELERARTQGFFGG